MRCAQCSFDASEGQRFCGRCGARLATACPACRQPNPPEFRFCGACGTALADAATPPADAAPPTPAAYTPAHLAARILTGRGALEGERRQVTVLFADVVGFTALAERLDPEAVHGIMDRCFRLLMDEIHHYEGTVNQFTGDGVMALFGAPLALEHAPERALRAALGIQAALRDLHDDLARTLGIDFQMRIGINSGLVVVGRIGDDLRMDYTALGDTANLAARLQTAAAPGAILISDQTAKLVSGRFVTRPVGPLRLKGKTEPVNAHEVVRALPRAPLVPGGERDLTPLVGRAGELTALRTLFARVEAGRGQVALVVGEAGIGKSRLIHEFRQQLVAEAPTWLEGRCVSFGRDMPFLPLIDAVKDRFAIEEADAESVIVDKIERGLAAMSEAGSGLAPYLRTLLAVDPGDPEVAAMDGSARRYAIFDALKRLLLATARERPLVLLVEDLHWIDGASEEFLVHLGDSLPAARVLLLCTYRPGHRPPFEERSYLTRLTLQPLNADEMTEMTAAMLGARQFPAEIGAVIAAKAEGNPFFVEEVTKSLVEIGALDRTPDGYVLGRPVGEIVIPDTIQDVIMARIDRLGEAPKRAIQIASVIGREFAVRLLRRASDLGPHVDVLVGELRALELIYEKSGVPELAYMFKHALTHDVAYASLLVQRRRDLHRIIGSATEELYADRLQEHWETLAHHFYRGEDWRRAFAYLVQAGNKARAAFANREALHFYERALEAASHLEVADEERSAIEEARGRAHFCVSEFPEAIAALRRALALTADPPRRARLQAALAEALLWAHEFDDAVTAAHQAIAGVEPDTDPGPAADGTYVLGFIHACRGEIADAGMRFEEGDRLCRVAGKPLRGGEIEVFQGLLANWRGDYRHALERIGAVLPILKDTNELLALAQTYSHFTITLGGAGEYGRALAVLDESIALTEAIGSKVWRARLLNTRGWILGELGAFEEADEANRRSLEIAAQLGSLRMAPELIGNAEANLADAALARGDLVGAEPHLSAVAGLLADRRNQWLTWRYGMHYRASAAELALARGDLGRARDCLTACFEAARRTGSRRYAVRAGRLLAVTQRAAGDVAGAERLLAAAARDARALGNPCQLWQALLAHAQALAALGRHEEARQVARDGLAVADGVLAAAPERLRATFATAPVGRALAELAG